jgi:hypothetical protein
MAIVVQGVGGVMFLAGLIGLWYGIDMLPTERGVAGTIASVTAMTGGVVTGALGLVLARLEMLTPRLAGRSERPRIKSEPETAAVPPPPVELPVAEPQRPRIEPTLTAPAPAVEPVPAPVASEPEKPKFALPGARLGAGIAAAGVAAGAAVAATTRTAVEAEKAVEDALIDLRKGMPAPAAPPPPDPMDDPPVEVLTPVEEPAEASPAPVEEGAPPTGNDPLQAFEAELDRLIPLKSGRKGRGKKEAAAPRQEEAPPVDTVAEAEPAAGPDPTPEPPAPEPTPILAAEPQPQPEPQAAIPTQPEGPAPDAEIVGAYESGGAKYTMYSDGSVIAEVEGHRVFFRSLEDLRVFIEGGASS